VPGWSDLAPSWPAQAGKSRELAFLEAVRSGYYVDPEWYSIPIAAAGHELTIAVGAGPLRVGAPGDSIEAGLAHWGTQKIADALGTVVSTAKIEDSIVAAAMSWGSFADAGQATARQIWTPQTQGAPSSTKNLEQASDWRDARPLDGLSAGRWKTWINDNRLMSPQGLKLGKVSGVNYGFWTMAPAVAPPAPGPRPSMTQPALVRVWQRPGTFHDWWHSDYSQLYRPIYRDGWITGPAFPDGAMVSLAELSEDPELWRLVRHDGPGPMRHPWIPPADDGAGTEPLIVIPIAHQDKAQPWAGRAAAGIVGAGVMAAAVAYEVLR